MAETQSGNRVKGGVLLFGLALAAILAAVGYRSLSTDSISLDDAELGTPLDMLEERVAETPDDGAAWQELGFLRFEQGEYGAAAAAYRKAAEIDPGEAVLWSALGEALVMDSKRDPLPPEALAAFERAVEIDADDPRARYFLAVKRDLDGDHRAALDEWLSLLGDTPPGAPWEGDLVRTIEQVGRINRIAIDADVERVQAARAAAGVSAGERLTAVGAIPGPTSAQIAAASAIPPGEQRQMAEGMVASLEQKLSASPANVDGWVMLMRSRMTLGQPDRARKALADAVAANPAAAARLQAEAEALGVR
jgi:cytochrome c-type biogenesis protein CcmH